MQSNSKIFTSKGGTLFRHTALTDERTTPLRHAHPILRKQQVRLYLIFFSAKLSKPFRQTFPRQIYNRDRRQQFFNFYPT